MCGVWVCRRAGTRLRVGAGTRLRVRSGDQVKGGRQVLFANSCRKYAVNLVTRKKKQEKLWAPCFWICCSKSCSGYLWEGETASGKTKRKNFVISFCHSDVASNSVLDQDRTVSSRRPTGSEQAPCSDETGHGSPYLALSDWIAGRGLVFALSLEGHCTSAKTISCSCWVRLPHLAAKEKLVCIDPLSESFIQNTREIAFV